MGEIDLARKPFIWVALPNPCLTFSRHDPDKVFAYEDHQNRNDSAAHSASSSGPEVSAGWQTLGARLFKVT